MMPPTTPPNNYTSVSYYRTNEDGDIIDKKGNLIIRSYDTYISNGHLVIDSSEFTGDGDITIFNNGRFYVSDGRLNLKKCYIRENYKFYIIDGGTLEIPNGYSYVDDNGDLTIKKTLFEDYPEFAEKKDGDIYFPIDKIAFGQKIRQPQAACTIMENNTGKVRAMLGGRGVTGDSTFNRATSPRQPGSSIKPIGVYAPALQQGYEKAEARETQYTNNTDGSYWGKYITAKSIINDSRMVTNSGKIWPNNSYNGYRGRITLKNAVQLSSNICAVKTFNQIGVNYSYQMLEKQGITSLVETDKNAAALALGGMSYGVSPLEMTAAYSTFTQKGEYKEPIFYTEVQNVNGETILKKDSKTTKIYDEGVAYIMTDILQSVVTNGTGTGANFYGQPVAGKTGTTSDQYDIWFCGYTPKYTMALWEGNDVNISLVSSSSAAASFWRNVMKEVNKNEKRGKFNPKPDNVVYSGGAYCLKNTIGIYY